MQYKDGHTNVWAVANEEGRSATPICLIALLAPIDSLMHVLLTRSLLLYGTQTLKLSIIVYQVEIIIHTSQYNKIDTVMLCE